MKTITKSHSMNLPHRSGNNEVNSWLIITLLIDWWLWVAWTEADGGESLVRWCLARNKNVKPPLGSERGG
jgi:hypothetical protein